MAARMGLGFIQGSMSGRPFEPGSSRPIFIKTRSCRDRWGWNLSCNSLKWWLASGGDVRMTRPRGSTRCRSGDLHRWTYRGQVIPADGMVTTRLVVTEVDDARRTDEGGRASSMSMAG